MFHLGVENKDDEYNTAPVAVVKIPLRHTIQQNNWDCGLSCVTMILSEKKLMHFNRNKEDIIAEEGIEFRYTIRLCIYISTALILM